MRLCRFAQDQGLTDGRHPTQEKMSSTTASAARDCKRSRGLYASFAAPFNANHQPPILDTARHDLCHTMYWQSGRCYWQTELYSASTTLLGHVMESGITFTFAAIFLGAAVLSSVALYARQPIIIAYIALGVALGPFGLAVVSDTTVSDAGHVGIIFLLFLLGLDMKPSALWNSLRQSTVVALVSATGFIAVGYSAARLLASRGLMPP